MTLPMSGLLVDETDNYDLALYVAAASLVLATATAVWPLRMRFVREPEMKPLQSVSSIVSGSLTEEESLCSETA